MLYREVNAGFFFNTKYTMCEKNVELFTVKPGVSFYILATRTSMVDDSRAIPYASLYSS